MSKIKIAILGSTSQVSKDIITSFSVNDDCILVLYARRPDAVESWLDDVGLNGKYSTYDLGLFGEVKDIDVVINFIGVGDPGKVAGKGVEIFGVTQRYDDIVLRYVENHPDCRYIFLSSGAAYGINANSAVSEKSTAKFDINHIKPQDWYGVIKFYTECKHRALHHLPIVDVRLFNYVSHTLDIDGCFLITEVWRAIKNNELLSVSPDNVVRDYIGPTDFYNFILSIIQSPVSNDVVDCYSNGPVSKMELLASMSKKYGLNYIVDHSLSATNATGMKNNYYSKNKGAKFYGYEPVYEALETVIIESDKVLM